MKVAMRMLWECILDLYRKDGMRMVLEDRRRPHWTRCTGPFLPELYRGVFAMERHLGYWQGDYRSFVKDVTDSMRVVRAERS